MERVRGDRPVTRAIRTFVDASERQSRVMIRLTWAILVLTAVMILAVGIQLYAQFFGS